MFINYSNEKWNMTKRMNLMITILSNLTKSWKKRYGLQSYQHRLFNKLLSFGRNIISNSNAPINLKTDLELIQCPEPGMCLRNNKIKATKAAANKYKQNTFAYVYNKIIDRFNNLGKFLRVRIFKG